MFDNEKEYKAYIDGMDQYIEALKKLRENDPEKAKRQARESLINSGIFNSDGTPKEQICEQECSYAKLYYDV